MFFRRESLDSHWTDFHENLYSSIFRISVEKIQESFKSDKNNGNFTQKNNMRFFLSYLAEFLEEEIFQIKVVEKIKTKILCSISFFDNRAAYEINV
jgi:hypothetical protein